jgi:hypothetical protein
MIDTDLLAFVVSMNTAAGNRVHLESPPQEDNLPLVVLRRAGGEQPGTTQGRRLWERSTIEVNVLGKSHSQSYPIMAAIRDALHGFKGLIGTTQVHESRCISFPDHITEIDGDNRRRWITAQFRFLHSEG